MTWPCYGAYQVVVVAATTDISTASWVLYSGHCCQTVLKPGQERDETTPDLTRSNKTRPSGDSQMNHPFTELIAQAARQTRHWMETNICYRASRMIKLAKCSCPTKVAPIQILLASLPGYEDDQPLPEEVKLGRRRALTSILPPSTRCTVEAYGQTHCDMKDGAVM
nr:hypothetical protein CFP56_09316 [Quercus suber]